MIWTNLKMDLNEPVTHVYASMVYCMHIDFGCLSSTFAMTFVREQDTLYLACILHS